MKFKILYFVFCLFILGCKTEEIRNDNSFDAVGKYHSCFKKVTDVMVHDIFSPPVASRVYAYTSIAGYEVARNLDSTYASMSSVIAHFPEPPLPNDAKVYNFEIASIYAMLTTAKNFIFSEDSLTLTIDDLLATVHQTTISKSVIQNSIDYGEAVAAHIIEWSKKDNYHQIRTYPKYSVDNNPARWKPTPPGYMDGIEPSWNKIRTMLMDSANQFQPKPPTKFDVTNRSSVFYKEMKEVYEVVNNATEEEIEIAKFWDCNPFKLNVSGHVMHATKKISPGGHWINITALASKSQKFDFIKSTYAYTMVSIGLFEAFISCWDEKYRSELTRPETVINEYLDPEWLPLLQTPPFPEYTSGHSVASSCSAIILSKLFGDQFEFVDDTEVEFGLNKRSFSSFEHAAMEASISRLYGGIHYRPAIEEGVIQGQKIGQLVVNKFSL